MTVTIRRVDTPADLKRIIEFPYELYANDPNWVPQLLSMQRDKFSKTKNPSWEYMHGDYFLAFRGDRLVGTIAAYINDRHNEFHDERAGWFGAFEVYDDAEAAQALLDTAARWVKDAGYPLIRGPQTFTTHEETGLLVDGFTRPVLLYPYNPPYYAGFIEAAGYKAVMDTYGFYMSAAKVKEVGLDERLERVTKAIMKRGKITVRPIDSKNIKADFQLFKDIYNVAWDKNWGFVPMTPRELDALVASLGQFLDHKLAFFAYVDGEPAGFILAIPDFNQVLQKVAPNPRTPEVISLLKALYHWKLKPSMDWVRVPLLGVKAEFRSKGVDAVLYHYVLQAALKGPYAHSDSGWILATNETMVSIAKNFGSEIYKTFRYYEKAL
ncbi:MAG: N-acetyltransferase [Anaerolineae bacterium]|nr:N-acetyltransferase [Chloroflexota bacterium]MBN8637844.1 N-acetyltransferase [Anaerolineae bacterium]